MSMIPMSVFPSHIPFFKRSSTLESTSKIFSFLVTCDFLLFFGKGQEYDIFLVRRHCFESLMSFAVESWSSPVHNIIYR